MRLFVIDPNTESRQVLVDRVYEALRRAQLKRVDVLDGNFEIIHANAGKEPPVAIVLGPGTYGELDQSVERIQSFFADTAIAAVLPDEIYNAEALELRRFLAARIIPLSDIAQLAQFVLDSTSEGGNAAGAGRAPVVGVVQLKGGVGASTLAASLCASWAHQGKRTNLIDLDDVNPHLTQWAKVSLSQQRVFVEGLEKGGLSANRLAEVRAEVPGYRGHFGIVGQPELYRESFHLKADVLPDAPSAAQFLTSFLPIVQDQSDVVVIDFARSWGIAAFSLLPFLQRILLVIDEDPTSVERTIANLTRFYRESDDPLEFDLARWSIVMNATSGRAVTEDIIRNQFAERELLPEGFPLFEIPFDAKGRVWTIADEAATPQTLYDLGAPPTRRAIEELGASVISPSSVTGGKAPQTEPRESPLRRIVSFLS